MFLQKHIDSFLSQQICYRSYAALRAILAIATLLTLLFNSPDTLFPELVSNHDPFYTKLFIGSFNLSYWIVLHRLGFIIFSSLILLFVIVGVYPRFTGALHFLVSFVFMKTCIVIDGGDQLCSNLTLLLLPITLLDNNKNHWMPSEDSFNGTISRTLFLEFEFLIMLQICVVYLHSSLGKFAVLEWMDGTAIWYWFTHEVFGTNYFLLDIVKLLLRNKYIIYSISWGVIVLELLIAMMLFVPKQNFIPKLVFPFGIALHIGIIFIHGLFSFGIVMIGCLIFYFKHLDGKHTYANVRT